MVPNLKIQTGDLPERVIVCGDPNRAKGIASHLDDYKLLSANREYHSYTGYYKGIKLAVVSHGVGAPGAAVCFEELIQAGAKVLIRVGTAGSYSKEIPPGSIVISTAAVRKDGFSSQFVPEGYPAVAAKEVLSALSHSASNIKDKIKIAEGITLTLDMFYQGTIPFPHEQYKAAGVLAVEMENAALFVISSVRGVKAGSILAIDGYADDNLAEVYNPNTDELATAIIKEVEIALEALISM